MTAAEAPPAASEPLPPLSHREMLATALPVTLAGLTTPLVGLVDTAVLGQLGSAHLVGAVAVGAATFAFLFTSLNFLRMTTASLASQAEGRNAPLEADFVLVRALLIALVCGAALIAFQGPLGFVAFTLLESSQAVEDAARTYFNIRIWAAPLTLSNYAVVGWLIGVGRAGTALKLQLALNIANVVFNCVLVFGFDLEIAGVAYGTVGAELLALASAGYVLRNHLRNAVAADQREALIGNGALLSLMTTNRDIFLRSLCLLTAFTMFSYVGARFGELTLAANAILFQLFLTTAYLLEGFETAGQRFVARAIGAASWDHYRRALWLMAIWSVPVAAGLSVFLWLAGPLLIDLISVNADVRAVARGYLPWAVASPVLGVWAFMMDAVFFGATRARAMRNQMVVSLLGYIAVMALAIPLMGNHGLWLALTLFFVFRAIGLWVQLDALEAAHFQGHAGPTTKEQAAAEARRMAARVAIRLPRPRLGGRRWR